MRYLDAVVSEDEQSAGGEDVDDRIPVAYCLGSDGGQVGEGAPGPGTRPSAVVTVSRVKIRRASSCWALVKVWYADSAPWLTASATPPARR